MKTALEPRPDGRGALSRAGRKPGSKTIITKTFEEFARATLADPEIRSALRQRVLDEIAGKKRNPMPGLAVLAAASIREKPAANLGQSVVFIAQITNGRGVVRRVELDRSDDAIDAETVPALPAADGQ